MKIEKEVRFFFPKTKSEELHHKLERMENLGEVLEMTVMYDNPNPMYTFYSSVIDGRLRLRKSGDAVILSWKRRIKSAMNDVIRQEEEIEIEMDSFENATRILEAVLKCKKMSSYERYRTTFHNFDSMIIHLDQFPYGIMLEIEAVDGVKAPPFLKVIRELGLDIKHASTLSCDDMYTKLCREQGMTPSNQILFNSTLMPQL